MKDPLSSTSYDHLPLEQKRAIVAELLRRRTNGCRSMPQDQLPALHVSELEHQKLVSSSTVSDADSAAVKSVAKALELRAAETPNAVALVFQDTVWTYQQLKRQADRLAGYLKSSGLVAGACVGLELGNTPEMLPALWGIIEAGGTIWPLKPGDDADSFSQSDEIILSVETIRKVLDGGHGEPQDRIPEVDEGSCMILGGHKSTQSLGSNRVDLSRYFEEMDRKVGCSIGDTLLTGFEELSVDGLLHLLWTQARGAKIVCADKGNARVAQARTEAGRIDFSLLFFSNDDTDISQDKYRLVTEAAKFADQHGFKAVWVPERHFHPFGGIYPNPSVLCAALATLTCHVRLRAGSVVLPLQHPIRVAEAWSMVDNLSGGRVDISFASGWNPNDFVTSPDTFAKNKEVLKERIEEVRKLWRGESIVLPNGLGQKTNIRIYPQPVQPELPAWMTAAGNPSTFRDAGRSGLNVLTMLFSSSMEELAKKIALYRKGRQEGGHQADAGIVTLMLHAFVHGDSKFVREKVRDPFLTYIRASTDAQRHGYKDKLSEEELDKAAAFAYERYFRTGALFGTPEACLKLVQQAKEIGVDEIACQLDFGVDAASVLESLTYLNQLKDLCNLNGNRRPIETKPVSRNWLALIREHRVSHLQCTAETLRSLTADADLKEQLGSVKVLIVRDPDDGKVRTAPMALPPAPARHGAVHPESKVTPTLADDIAIVGVAGRFPQSSNLEEFWKNLAAGKDLITGVPLERWAGEAGQSTVRYGGFLDDVDAFDPQFFDIPGKEAASMDPHQRLFLQTVWETLEDAGYQPSNFAETRVGLFVGMYSQDYNHLLTKHPGEAELHGLTGRLNVMVPNRVSYLLNFRGPSELVDTACSSSLVAIHRAVSALRSGECELAVAGGVSLLLSPESWNWLGKAELLSEDGKCRPFENDANGLVRGEGVGAVLLKPLSQATADGDHIYALVKGTAANHNGRLSTSLTTPSTHAQADLVVHAYENAKVEPETVGYIEAHGAASEMGDFVEINAFKSAFASLSKKSVKAGRRKHYCGIGTLKPNIGALDAAGGIAAVIKVVLALQHKKLPATINFQRCHPDIDLADTPFYIVSQTMNWEPISDDNGTPLPRRAGVHAYGLGGVNAHVLLQEYDSAPGEARAQQEDLPVIIILSARNQVRLQEYAKRLSRYLETSSATLSDIAYTLQIGRKAMPVRLSVLARSKEELKQGLDEYLEGRVGPGVLSDRTDSTSKVSDSPMVIQNRELHDLAASWVAGAEIDWQQRYRSDRRRRVSLPTYPFARDRYSLPDGPAQVGSFKPLHPLLDKVIPSLKGATFKKHFRSVEPVIRDHVLNGKAIVPAAAYVEMALAAGKQVSRGNVYKLEGAVFPARLHIPETGAEVQVCLEEANDKLNYKVTSTSNGPLRIHCQGTLVTQRSTDGLPVQRIDFRSVQARCQHMEAKEEIYSRFERHGIRYGPYFRGLDRIWFNDQEALGSIHLPPGNENDWDTYRFHPALMDAVLQTSLVLSGNRNGSAEAMLPFSLEELEIVAPLSSLGYAYLKASDSGEAVGIAKYHAVVLDETGRVLIKIRDFCVKEVPAEQPQLGSHATFGYPAFWERGAGGEGIEGILARVEAGKLSIDEAQLLLDSEGIQAKDTLVRRFAEEFRRHHAGGEFKLGLNLSVDRPGSWTLSIGPQQWDVQEGIEKGIGCLISSTRGDFAELLEGNIEPTVAFLTKRLTIEPADATRILQTLGSFWFRCFNERHLSSRFKGHVIGQIYQTGHVEAPDGYFRNIFPWAIPADAGALLYDQIVHHRLDRTLEIGMGYGLSTLFVCQAHGDKGEGEHVAIDPCQKLEFQSVGLLNIQRAGLQKYLRFIEEPDYLALPKLLDAGEPFQLVFIDGLHLFDYALVDFFYSDRLLAENGYIIFDDCHVPGVEKVIAYLRQNRQYEQVELSCERIAAFKKLKQDDRSLDNPNFHREF
jgi:natural product biosynthesis luciferase-like monooxygenase protein